MTREKPALDPQRVTTDLGKERCSLGKGKKYHQAAVMKLMEFLTHENMRMALRRTYMGCTTRNPRITD